MRISTGEYIVDAFCMSTEFTFTIICVTKWNYKSLMKCSI